MDKRFWLGFIGFLGFLGFKDPWYFAFFLFFLFFLDIKKPVSAQGYDVAKGAGGALEKYNKEAGVKKEEAQVKIMELLNGQDKISNNDVQKMLGVSDASATNYLNELEKQGKIKQVGGTGRGVYYMRPNN